MAKVASNLITVFPSANRSEGYDIFSKYTTEQNLTNLVNRLSPIKNFVILDSTTSEIGTDGSNLIPISFSMNGYYFTIRNLKIPTRGLLTSDVTKCDYIWAVIRVAERTSHTEETVSISTRFLGSIDGNHDNALDVREGTESATCIFHGLDLYVTNEPSISNIDSRLHKLLLVKRSYRDNGWHWEVPVSSQLPQLSNTTFFGNGVWSYDSVSDTYKVSNAGTTPFVVNSVSGNEPSLLVNGISQFKKGVSISDGGTLSVSGNLTAQSGLTVSGAASMAGNLSVGGTISSAGRLAAGGLTVNGGATNLQNTTMTSATVTGSLQCKTINLEKDNTVGGNVVKFKIGDTVYEKEIQAIGTIEAAGTVTQSLSLNSTRYNLSSIFVVEGGQVYAQYAKRANVAATAESATIATNLSNAPSIAANGSAIKVTVGGKTSNTFTVPYATISSTATNLTAAPSITTAGSGKAIQITVGGKTSTSTIIPYAANSDYAASVPEATDEEIDNLFA